MARIPEETLQAIRDRVDLVDLIGRHVHLKKAGRNFVGLCPFHQEKTPSFHVNVEKQIFHCFGCGEGGNGISFLMKHENLTFPEAARAIARQLGIEVPERESAGEVGVSERLRAANQVAQDLYRECLGEPQGDGARDYLARRGLGPEEIARFGIGFAPPSGRALVARLEREKIPAATGETAGLLGKRERHFDMLRGRITFPIQDARGQVLGFGGRALGEDQTPKYLNTPESPVYRKREALYGLHLAIAAMRRAERAVVVEGYFDRIAMHRAGVEEAVATCGTALTSEHARALARRTRRVVLVFDGDEAGQRAVESSLPMLLPEGLRVDAVLLPSGQDPDELLSAEGAEGLRARVDAAEPALDLVMRRAVAGGCFTPQEKADAVARVAPLLACVPEAVERGELVRRLALTVRTDAAAVEQAVGRAGRGAPGEAVEAPPAPAHRMDQRVRWTRDNLLGPLFADPTLAQAMPADALNRLIPESPERRALELALGSVRLRGTLDLAAIELESAAGDAPALSVLRAAALLAPPEHPQQVFHDTVARLEDFVLREHRRELQRHRNLTGDPLLPEAQQDLERRRERAKSPQNPISSAAT